MELPLAAIAETFGTPCFVYDVDQIRARVETIRATFSRRFEISYAVKCNPNLSLLGRLRGIVDMLDISSGGELTRAVTAGWDRPLLSFTGPAKRDKELRAAVDESIGYVIVESVEEAKRLARFASAGGKQQPVLIRIAPIKVPAGFGSRMGGKPSQFGIDEEALDAAVVEILRLGSLRLEGFHLYAGTQCLSAEAVAENIEQTLGIFRRVCIQHDIQPTKLIIGSGFGIPYYETDQPLDLSAVAARVLPEVDALRRDNRFAQAALVLEMGRFLVGEAGIYLTRIVSAKRSRGTEIRLCDGGMNHHLGACGHLGSVIRRNYRMFKVGAKAGGEPLTPFDLYGPLCTSIDALAHRVELPPLAVGDVIGVHCSGAYGPTASPLHFISHEPPREVLVETVASRQVLTDVTTRWGMTEAPHS